MNGLAERNVHAGRPSGSLVFFCRYTQITADRPDGPVGFAAGRAGRADADTMGVRSFFASLRA
jgi:hypothetical protein